MPSKEGVPKKTLINKIGKKIKKINIIFWLKIRNLIFSLSKNLLFMKSPMKAAVINKNPEKTVILKRIPIEIINMQSL